MTRHVTFRYVALTGVASGATVAVVIAGQPHLAVFAAALLAWTVVGTVAHRWPDIEVTPRLAGDRVVEGDTATVEIDLLPDTEVPWLELILDTPRDLRPVDGVDRAIVALPGGRRATVRFDLHAERWGVSSPRYLRVAARDRLGLFVSRRVYSLDLPVKVHPSDRRLETMIRSSRTSARVGYHLASQRGEGCEYADVRPLRPGDRLRAVNWRVTMRRDGYWVSDRHPDLASDIVLLMDSSQGLGRGVDSTLHTAVRAALALTEGHLGHNDRVGLLDVGRQVRWFRPQMGRLQARQLVDALLDTRIELGLGVRKAADLPLHHLGSGTTIVALTPLLDPAPSRLLLDLHDRGHDIVAIWCQPDIERIRTGGTRVSAIARRLWDMERDRWRQQLVEQGVTVVAWTGEGSLDPVTAAIDASRQRGRSGAAGVARVGRGA